MRRYCFVGNSHVAALKLGWDRLRKQFADVELDFFAGPQKSMDETSRVGARLVPTDRVREFFRHTSGGQEEIDLARYHHLVLVGMTFRFDFVIEAYMRMRTEAHRDQDAPLFVSEAAFEEAILGRVRAQSFFRTLQKVRDAGPTLWAVPLPRASERVLDPDYSDHPLAAGFKAALANGDEVSLSRPSSGCANVSPLWARSRFSRRRRCSGVAC